MNTQCDAAFLGAGFSGCPRVLRLRQQNRRAVLLERSDRLLGRIRAPERRSA
jgi:monoamine oxidase